MNFSSLLMQPKLALGLSPTQCTQVSAQCLPVHQDPTRLRCALAFLSDSHPNLSVASVGSNTVSVVVTILWTRPPTCGLRGKPPALPAPRSPHPAYRVGPTVRHYPRAHRQAKALVKPEGLAFCPGGSPWAAPPTDARIFSPCAEHRTGVLRNPSLW